MNAMKRAMKRHERHEIVDRLIATAGLPASEPAHPGGGNHQRGAVLVDPAEQVIQIDIGPADTGWDRQPSAVVSSCLPFIAATVWAGPVACL